MTQNVLKRTVSGIALTVSLSATALAHAQTVSDAAVGDPQAPPPPAAEQATSARRAAQAGPAAQAGGVDEIQEVIVRAQRRDERLQDAPVSITAVTADNLAKLNGRDLSDISRTAPNIQFAANQGGSGLSMLTIRGIGQQQAGLLSDPGAAVYVDDVYRPRLSNNTLNFTDIDRLEVLRGPQGTLFGKNSIGGALSIYTPKPAFTFSSRASLEVGSRDLVNASAAVNLPINDQVAVRLAGQSVRQDGYMHNLEDGQDYNNLKYYSLRGALLYQPNSSFDLVLRGDYTRQDQKGTGYKVIAGDPSILTAGGYETRGTAPSFNRGTDAGVSVTANWDIGLGSIKSISAYRWFSNDFADDTDSSPMSLQAVQTLSKEEFFSQEFQHSIGLADDRLRLTTGLFYIEEKIKYDSFPRLAIFSLDNYSRQTTKSYAIFSQVDFKATERFDVSFGLRYSKDEKHTTFVSNPTGVPVALIDADVHGAWSAVTPKVTAQYRFTPSVMAYATVSRGFKSGGVNGQPIQTSDFQPFDQEMVTNYEAGLKSEFFNRRALANISIFQMNYDDMQVGITAFNQNVVKNAGRAVIKGFEGEFSAKPTRGLTLTTSIGYNDFKYTQLDADAIASGLNYGLVLPMAPKLTLNSGIEYKFPISDNNTLSARVDYSYRSKIYFDANNSEVLAQKGYGLLSARIVLDHDKAWSLYAFGNNLADKYYRVSATTGLGVTVIVPGRPREVGLGASLSF